MDRKTCFVILGLQEGATLEDIRNAYRKLAKQYHPDRTQGDEFLTGMFRKIQGAYEFLTQEIKEEEQNHNSYFRSRKPDSENSEAAQLVDAFLIGKRKRRELEEQQEMLKHYLSSKPIDWKKILASLAICLCSLYFFYPDTLKGIEPAGRQSANPTTQILLYQKPDIKSTVLMKPTQQNIIDSLGTTKYFHKVRVATPTDTLVGYILKENNKP